MSTLFGIVFVVFGTLGIIGTYILFTAWEQFEEGYSQPAETASALTRWIWWRPWPSRSRRFQLLFGWSICLLAIVGGLSMLVA